MYTVEERRGSMHYVIKLVCARQIPDANLIALFV